MLLYTITRIHHCQPCQISNYPLSPFCVWTKFCFLFILSYWKFLLLTEDSTAIFASSNDTNVKPMCISAVTVITFTRVTVKNNSRFSITYGAEFIGNRCTNSCLYYYRKYLLGGPTKVKPTYIFVSKIWITFKWIDKIQWFLVNAITVHSHLGKHKNLILFVRWRHKG